MKNFIILLTVLLTGCSGSKITDEITSAQIAMSGNKPPAFFRIVNEETMKNYIFHTEDFSFQFPTAKPSDFTEMDGWSGMSINDGKTIAFGFKNSIIYHVSVSTSGNSLNYSERVKAIENNDIAYLRTRMPKRVKDNGEIHNITLNTKRVGKENYSCIVRESSIPKYNKYLISYGCYKVNPNNTKVLKVSVTATYNKPKDPTLAKKYTYEDLKRRAKRTLDSLYIKDNW